MVHNQNWYKADISLLDKEQIFNLMLSNPSIPIKSDNIFRNDKNRKLIICIFILYLMKDGCLSLVTIYFFKNLRKNYILKKNKHLSLKNDKITFDDIIGCDDAKGQSNMYNNI